MKFNFKQWSLKTRITLFTMSIVMSSIWSLAFYASQILESDMQRLLGEQQFSSASYVATQINDELNDRILYLQAIASSISPALLRNTERLQDFLEQKKILPIMFNGGAFIILANGTAIADTQPSTDRTGINYKDKDFTISALTEGKLTISPPFMEKNLHAPVISMAAPIKDSAGKVFGALLGITNLGKPNYLDKITNNTFGKTGGYVLVVPNLRLIITATDKSRIMQTLPTRGVVPTIDRFMDGYEGSAVYVNPLGVEVLGSAKAIPVSNWLLGIILPTADAMTPIHEMQRRILLATLLLTLLAGILTWWMLRRQLSPMLTAVQNMSTLSTDNQSLQPLPITRQDEIGTMIAGFNRLLKTLGQQTLALKKSDDRATAAIESSPVPIALNDEHGNITFLNRAFTQLLGYSQNDIPTLAEWWPRAYPNLQYRQQVANLWQKNLDDAKRSNSPFSPMELNICCKDGSIRTLLVSAAAFEGGFTHTHMVILYDITERKKIEKTLIATSEQLNEAQHIAQIGNWTLNFPSNELIWSDQIFNLFEIDVNQFGATYETFLNAIHPDDRAAVNQAYSNSLVTRMPYEIVHRLRMSDGRIKWVREKCKSDFNADGSPLQSRGMVQDITASKLTELDLIATRDEANRANQAKSEFLSSMSHELRTPLNAILGFSQLLQYESNLSEEVIGNVSEILHAGYHLLELINQVLDLSRIESGHIDLSPEPVKIRDIIDESLNLLGSMAEKRNIRIDCCGLNGAIVRADYTRLKQVLLNLLSNAIKYNREGGSVRIELRQQAADRLRVLVIDSGYGIPAGRMAELFTPFNRLGAENSSIPGSGIGLTITRRIMEAMGGMVDVESEAGTGSTFWIELPLERVPTPIPAQLNNDRDSSLQKWETRRNSLLYIEDNPSNLRLVEQILGRRKHIRLISAHAPKLGIDLALTHRPELILLDINMPNMDGYQVLKVLKDNPTLKSVPVIAISANVMPRDIERGRLAGFNDYLTKPIDVDKFLKTLDHYLPESKNKV